MSEEPKEFHVRMARATDEDLRLVREFLDFMETQLDEASLTSDFPILQKYVEADAQGSFERVITGYHVLRDSLCDPTLSYLDVNSDIKELNAAATKLLAACENALNTLKIINAYGQVFGTIGGGNIPAIISELEAAIAAAKGALPQAPVSVRPRVVCLCGSTRFKSEFIQANFTETMAGKIVLTVGWFGHADGQVYTPTPAEKIALDELHKRKIDLADEVLVINVGGYIGASTRSEIEYAAAQGNPIRYLQPG